jgi:type II secretory pathway component PulM
MTSKNLEKAKEQSKIEAILGSNRWRHRRRMAYTSLIAMLVVTYWCMFEVSEERLKLLDQIITWFYTIMGAIVTGYLGFATIDDKWKESKKDGPRQ